jgi:DNA polymerase I
MTILSQTNDDTVIDGEKYFTLFEQFTKDKENESKTTFNLNSRVLIVDFLNMFIRSFTGSPAMNDDGEHVGGITGFLYSLGNAIRLTQATRCILISDGEGGSARRRKIYPDYKNKSRAKSINRAYDFKTQEEEERAMQLQLLRLLQYLKHLPVQIVTIDQTEADDVIAYLAQEVFNKPEEKVTIVSSDKDFLQLVNDRITVWSPTKKKLYTPAKVLEEYGITPENFLLFRMLDGDPSDNIPGVKGTGLKTMKKYLPMVTEAQKHTIDEILDYAEKGNSGKKKKAFYAHLLESKETLLLNEKLMQLESPPISASAKMKVTEKVTEVEIPTLNKYEIHLMYIHDKLSNAIPNIEEWLLKTFNILNSFALNQKK